MANITHSPCNHCTTRIRHVRLKNIMFLQVFLLLLIYKNTSAKFPFKFFKRAFTREFAVNV